MKSATAAWAQVGLPLKDDVQMVLSGTTSAGGASRNPSRKEGNNVLEKVPDVNNAVTGVDAFEGRQGLISKIEVAVIIIFDHIGIRLLRGLQ